MHPHIFDSIVNVLDHGLRNTFTKPAASRTSPGSSHSIDPISQNNALIRHSASLMRVNHVGEVCAQALYQGQALTSRSNQVREKMQHAANEEIDHLNWCYERIEQLNSHTSYLNPLWYAGSFAIGITAGLAGDKWSLGFLAETEKQVVKHLEHHLGELPEEDIISREIITQMRDDEEKHADMAIEQGAAELPKPIKQLMRLTAKVMTSISARI